MKNEIRVQCSQCGEPSINPHDNPDQKSTNEEVGYECSECGGMTFMTRENMIQLRQQVYVVQDNIDHSDVMQRIAEAMSEISYVAGALDETREDKFQEDLFQAEDQLKKSMKSLRGEEIDD